MRIRNRVPRAVLALGVTLSLLIAGDATPLVDDVVLFSTSVTPNVLILLDNSGSMNHIVWHEDFDPSAVPSCDNWDNDAVYTVPGDLDKDKAVTACTLTRTVFADMDMNEATRYTGRYLNWLFSPEADDAYLEIDEDANGFPSSCVGGNAFAKYKRSRITTAKQVLKDVACEANLVIDIRFGMSTFREHGTGDPNGGFVQVPCQEYTSTQAADFVSAIQSLDAKTHTPSAEALYQVYTYFMSRTESERPFGKDGVTRFPMYSYTTSVNQEGGLYAPDKAPESPVQYSCQKNFVLMVTDGAPTRDDFDEEDPIDTTLGFPDFRDKLIGDYNPDGEVEEQDDLVCLDCETTLYLDDVALFMQTNDFHLGFDDDQTIDTYTVGFGSTAVANALLKKTAAVGNGLFFHANNYDELTRAIIAAMTDIIEKSQSFTAATVPATRTTAGENLYVSLFVPSGKTPYWEGHLKNFQITAAGEIWDANDNCALDDPTPGQCFSGPILPAAVPFWEAGEEIPPPVDRKLITSMLSAPVPFDMTLQAADLGVVFPPATPYLRSTALNAEGLTDEIIQNVRGCWMGTGVETADVLTPLPCDERPWLLGDIFHSNPVLVGPPALFLNEPSYEAFEQRYAKRDRVIYAGANDGFLRGFLAGRWDADAIPPGYDHGTGKELFGFMPYPGRQKVKDLPNDLGGRGLYFVDGSPTVTDAWFYDELNFTSAAKAADGSDWHTVLVGGMRQGGETVYALDISDPTSGEYPEYLWEFPREDAPASLTDYVGQTWSEPILTKIRVKVNGDHNEGKGYERWVAIFAGGYDTSGDPNIFTAYDANATKGRGIFIVDITTGKLLASKTFDPGAAVGDPQREMRFAIPSTPGVYDLDFDGYADVIYVGDLGGNVWKWVIHPIGEDRVNDAVGGTTQPNWPFKKFFEAPVYQDKSGTIYHKSFFFPPGATFRNRTLWLALGTGERTNLKFMGDESTAEDNNRFYAMTDLDPLEQAVAPYPTLTEDPDEPPVPENPGLSDVTNDESCVSLTDKRGYYFVADDGEKFVTNVDIFFYYVFVGSYIPTEALDPCETGGLGALYIFKIHCGEGFFGSEANPERDLDVGAGMPTDPRITIGTDGDTSNRVIINKQTGEIMNVQAPPGFGAGVGMFYWREMD